MPLNEREQKILEEIERQFYQEDPKLAQTVAKTTLESVKRKWQRLAVVGFVVGVAVMLAFFTSSTVIAIGDQNDVALYRTLTSAGITDYLVKPILPEAIDMAMEAAAEGPVAEGESAPSGQVIAFVGAHGGVGTTTLAVNTAWAIANEQNKQTAIVDLDLKFGSVSLALDVDPSNNPVRSVDSANARAKPT